MGSDARQLLSDEKGYDITENSITSKLVNIDNENQIMEFKGTGIKIDADDHDYSDWKNGIFKNRDGSVDIDLGKNKFIDVKNGFCRS